jgi:hypothetical protein
VPHPLFGEHGCEPHATHNGAGMRRQRNGKPVDVSEDAEHHGAVYSTATSRTQVTPNWSVTMP